MNENKQPNKSIDELLKMKKTKPAEKTNDDASDMRKKMNRLVDANKVFDDVNNYESKSLQLEELEAEKQALEKELKEANKKLKSLYNLKYEDLKIIDKKNDNLTNEFKAALDNAKSLNEEEKARFENMNLELASLQSQIKALKANNIASRKASEEAIAAANLAEEAATKARLAFEEKEKNANKDYKEEIEKLNKQLVDVTTKLNKSNVEKTKLKNNVSALKKTNEEQVKTLAKVEQDLLEATKTKNEISLRLKELEKNVSDKENQITKLDETKANVKDDSQKEISKLESKVTKLLDEKNVLKEKLSTLQKDYNKSEQKVQKLIEEKATINANISNLKQELASANSSIKKLENNVAKLETLKQEKISEIANLKKENTSLSKKIEKLQNDLNESLNKLTDETLKKQYEEKKKELDKLQTNYNKALDNISTLKESQKQKLQEAKAQAKKEASEKFKEEKNQLKQEHLNEIKDLNKQIEKLNLLISEKESRISELKNSIEDSKTSLSTIEELKIKIENNADKITSLESKNKELEALVEEGKNSEETDKIIDSLTLKLVDHEEQISVLEDKNKELEDKASVIPTLNEEIEKLNQGIKLREEQIFLLQEQIKEPKIDESVIKEMDDLQNELDKTASNLKDMRNQKLNLETELQKAYNSLKEQEDILSLQDNLITKQQVILDKKNIDYQESLKKYQDLEAEFEKAKNQYSQELSLLKQDNSGAQDKLSGLFDLQNQLDEANLEIEKKTIQLSDASKAIEELKQTKEKNEEIIKQYLNDIEVNEKKLSDYLVSVSQSEIYLEEVKNRLAQVNQEYASYREEAEKELNELNVQLFELKEKVNLIDDSNKKLELSKFNEERLQSRIYDLENSIRVLSINDKSKSDSNVISSLEQYRALLANERKEHLEFEEILNNKVKDLNQELENLNTRFVNYSSSYIIARLNKQINSINEIISSIKTGKTSLNRDVYNEYYEDALKMYYEQKKIYASEIDKRNEMLQIIKSEKEQEIKDLSYEVQVNGVNTVGSAKLKVLYQQVKDIDLIINTSIRSYSPMSTSQVEEEILKSFKKELFVYHKQMEDNINLIEKHINEKYNEAETFEKLLELYSNDCLEMANKYSDEISRLYEENQFDDNQFSNLIREEKILMLVNEFQNLVRIRDEKYTSLQNKIIDKENDISYDEYNDSLNQIEDLKISLLKQLDSINLEEQKVKGVLFDERKRIFEDIEALNEQLDQLEFYNNDEVVEEDKRKVNVLLAAKKEKLELLDESRIPEMEDKYSSLKEEVKISYDEAVMEEKAIKEAFAKRKEAVHASKNINNNISQQIKKFNAYENINSYLVDLNNIDLIFSEIRENRKNYRPVVREKQNMKVSAYIEKYRNLWSLYDKYELAKKTMEEDFAEIRAYNNLKLEASSTYRKYCEYLDEIDVSEERFKSGFDLDQNILKNLHAKANTAKSRVDYLNKQASDLLRNSYVDDYVELVHKIEQIRELIKKMDTEIEGII